MTKRKGRRLKRFLGLKRKSYDGGIDVITPSRISGWVYGYNNIFDKVQLKVGEEVLAEAIVDLARADVSQYLDINIDPGFDLFIPRNISISSSKKMARLVAISSYKNKEIILSKFKSSKRETSVNITSILKSEILGLDGFVEGFNYNGNIYGWAGSSIDDTPISIWMHCKNDFPIIINCEKWKPGLDRYKIKNINSGFVVDTSNLSPLWSKQEIFFSFDREGKYKLPTSTKLILGELTNREEDVKNTSIRQEIVESTEKDLIISKYNERAITLGIEKQWEEVNKQKILLDNLELLINKEESSIKYKLLNIFKKIRL